MTTRLANKATQSSIQHASGGTVTDAIDVQRQLTDRDRTIIQLLAEHQALTTEQITRVGFDSPITATHRLALLARRGVLARFRRCQRPGSQSWRYTLGTLGAMMHAAEHGQPIPRPSRIAERILTLAQSPRLDHLLGVNDMFTALLHRARHHHACALDEWWSERKIARTVGEIVRPDGYGEWTAHTQTGARTVGFFLEYDTGTEQLSRLLDKLDAYRQLDTAGISRPVLFVLSSTVRENNLHTAITRHAQHARELVVATVATDHLAATGRSPADPVWLVAGTSRRVSLIDLPSPAPSTSPAAGPVEHASDWPDIGETPVA